MSEKVQITKGFTTIGVAESAKINGKEQLILGDYDKDLIFRTKGTITIQVGNKFINLLTENGSVTSVINGGIVTITEDISSVQTSPGDLVFDSNAKILYVNVANNLIPINNTTGQIINGAFISYSEVQELTPGQKDLALTNIGYFVDNRNVTSANTTLIFSKEDLQHYTFQNGVWTPLYLSTRGGLINGTLSFDKQGDTSVYIWGNQADGDPITKGLKLEDDLGNLILYNTLSSANIKSSKLLNINDVIYSQDGKIGIGGSTILPNYTTTISGDTYVDELTIGTVLQSEDFVIVDNTFVNPPIGFGIIRRDNGWELQVDSLVVKSLQETFKIGAVNKQRYLGKSYFIKNIYEDSIDGLVLSLNTYQGLAVGDKLLGVDYDQNDNVTHRVSVTITNIVTEGSDIIGVNIDNKPPQFRTNQELILMTKEGVLLDSFRKNIVIYDTVNSFVDLNVTPALDDESYIDTTRPYIKTPNSVLGNLSDIIDTELKPLGYGLYSQNAYLYGKANLNYLKLGDELLFEDGVLTLKDTYRKYGLGVTTAVVYGTQTASGMYGSGNGSDTPITGVSGAILRMQSNASGYQGEMWISGSQPTSNPKMFIRNVQGTTKGNWSKVYTDSDITATNIANWNTAYGWGQGVPITYTKAVTIPFKVVDFDTLPISTYVDTFGNGSTNQPAFTNGSPSGFLSIGAGTYGFQLLGDRNGNNLGFRSGITAGYSPWRTLWHDGNLTQTSINNWNTAFGWGNHNGLYSSRAFLSPNGINSVRAFDSRSANYLPTTDLRAGVMFEFKQSAAIGFNAATGGIPGTQTYASAITMAPYGDDSGNNYSSFQLAQSNGVLGFRQYAAGWQPWRKIWTTADFASLNFVTLDTEQTITAYKAYTSGFEQKLHNNFFKLRNLKTVVGGAGATQCIKICLGNPMTAVMWELVVDLYKYTGTTTAFSIYPETTQIRITGYNTSVTSPMYNGSVRVDGDPGTVNSVKWYKDSNNLIYITIEGAFGSYPKASIREINLHHNITQTVVNSIRSNVTLELSTDLTDLTVVRTATGASGIDYVASQNYVNTTVTNASTLIAVTESNGTGYRLRASNAANHGDIGIYAIDLSTSNQVGNNGATGSYSGAFGLNNVASGSQTFVAGVLNTVSGGNSAAFGQNNNITIQYGFAAGRNNKLDQSSDGSAVFGTGNTIWQGAMDSLVVGNSNTLQAGGMYSIVGGSANIVDQGTSRTLVVGGSNTIKNAASSLIAGTGNETSSFSNSVLSGNMNYIQNGGQNSILVGDSNITSSYVQSSAIFGRKNTLNGGLYYGLIFGSENTHRGYSGAFIGGIRDNMGYGRTINNDVYATHNTFTFGDSNVNRGRSSQILGSGLVNTTAATFTIGIMNKILVPITGDFETDTKNQNAISGTLTPAFVIGNGGIVPTHGWPASLDDNLRSNAYQMMFDGSSTQFGIASYGADYSLNYTDRSLVDKGFVVSNLEASLGYGLYKSATTGKINVGAILSPVLEMDGLIDVPNMYGYYNTTGTGSMAVASYNEGGTGFVVTNELGVGDLTLTAGTFRVLIQRPDSTFAGITIDAFTSLPNITFKNQTGETFIIRDEKLTSSHNILYPEDDMSTSPSFGNAALINKFYADSLQTLIKITEGGNTGYRYKGYNDAYFGNIGVNATDLTVEYTLPNSAPFLHLQPFITAGTMGATGRFAFTSGGANVASGNQGVAMGLGSVASGASSLAMGQACQATGSRSVAMNDSNTASGSLSAAIGGSNNIVSGNQSVVLGGYQNKVLGVNSVVLGGSSNTATGSTAFVIGGINNNANSNGAAVINSTLSESNGAYATVIASNNAKILLSAQANSAMHNSVILGSWNATIQGHNGGAQFQAIIASQDSVINAGILTDGSTSVTGNTVIIAGQNVVVNKNSTCTLVTGQGTIGVGSGQLVCGVYNEDQAYVAMYQPTVKRFIIGGGTETVRKTIFYVQHNGLVVATNDIEITDPTKGVVLRSPDASRWRITVDDAGQITTTKLT